MRNRHGRSSENRVEVTLLKEKFTVTKQIFLCLECLPLPAWREGWLFIMREFIRGEGTDLNLHNLLATSRRFFLATSHHLSQTNYTPFFSLNWTWVFKPVVSATYVVTHFSPGYLLCIHEVHNVFVFLLLICLTTQGLRQELWSVERK